MNEFIAFETDSTAAPTDAGNARHAGIIPIRTVALPGPGASGGPWLVMSVVRAARGIN